MIIRNVAVLIDFENVSSANDVETVLKVVARRGKVMEMKAFGDWTGPIENSQDELKSLGVKLVHQPNIGKGRNGCDMRMVIEAMDLLHDRKAALDTFVLVTCDVDFVPLAERLKSAGKAVIGAGRPEVTSDLFRATVDEFIPVGKDVSADTTMPRSTPPQRVAMQALDLFEPIRFNDINPTPINPINQQANGALDPAIQTLILNAMYEVSRKNKGVVKGAPLHESMKTIQPSFDFRALGFRSFADMLGHDQFLEIRGRGQPGDITVWTRTHNPRRRTPSP